MRIGLVSQEYPPETAKGGIGSQTFLKAHGLAALGHDVSVISRSVNSRRLQRQDGAVQVTRIPGAEHRLSIQTEIADWLTYSTEVAAAIASLHAVKPFDLVEFPEWAAEGFVHLLNQTEWNRISSIVQLHGPLVMLAHTIGWPDPATEFYRTGTAMESVCLRLADAVYSSSYCSAAWCCQQYGLKKKNLPVLHAGVDTQLFAPCEGLRLLRPTIVFAGKLVPNKGVDLLVDAACRLAESVPDLRVRLIGRGEPAFIEKLRAKANATGNASLLDFVGFVGRDDLPAEMARAHLFAAPSRYEGGPGFVYLEAMACGLPVIACAGSGAAEVVCDGETGFLVPPGNVDALVDALQRILSDDARRQLLGANARRFVVENADTAKCVAKIEAFYRDVLNGGLAA